MHKHLPRIYYIYFFPSVRYEFVLFWFWKISPSRFYAAFIFICLHFYFISLRSFRHELWADFIKKNVINIDKNTSYACNRNESFNRWMVRALASICQCKEVELNTVQNLQQSKIKTGEGAVHYSRSRYTPYKRINSSMKYEQWEATVFRT